MSAQPDMMFAFALLGARASSFHHDLAAKLQGLMMALDEIGDELAGGRHEELHEASATARKSLEELTSLLAANRALARDARSRISLREAVAAASARANIVVRGAIPNLTITACVPALIQALAMLFASTGKNRRGSGGVIDVRVDGDVLSFDAGPDGTSATELAIAAWALARDGGELRCGRELVVRLPTGQAGSTEAIVRRSGTAEGRGSDQARAVGGLELVGVEDELGDRGVERRIG